VAAPPPLQTERQNRITSAGGSPLAEVSHATEIPSVARGLGLYEGAICFVASAATFFTFGLLTLQRGHPEEDAYIMFRYAEHVAQGRGIVFNPLGPRAEGATDFLWMVLLSALDALGLDVAVASVLLNALGAGLAAVILAAAVSTALPRRARWIWLALTTACVPFLSSAMAAYGCFSSMLYAAIALSAMHVCVRGSRRSVLWLPALVLTLGLFRPDGAVVAAPVAVLGAMRAWRLGLVRPYLFGLGAVVASGAAYFVWRYSYFGLLLPLPLYVKSRIGDIDKLANYPEAIRAIAKVMPGLGANVHWFMIGGVGAALAVIAVALFLLYRAERSWQQLARRVTGAAPALLLLASLTFAYQTQNFHWRFQAPIQLAVIYFAVLSASAVTVRKLVHPIVGTAMVAASVIYAMQSGVTGMTYHLDPARGGYLNVFAARYGRVQSQDTRVALTEAGRFPFWSPAACLDTIGLNSPEAAVGPVTRKMIADFDPHILLLHHAMTMNFEGVGENEKFIRLTSIRPLIQDRFKEAFDRDYTDYKQFPFSSVKLPSLVMVRYLEDRLNDFEIYAIDTEHDGSYGHIFAFRKDTDTARALNELRAALEPENRRSYLALRRDQATDRARGSANAATTR
jgi:hypothetical protein